MTERDPFEALQGIASRTADLAPDAGFTDAVLRAVETAAESEVTSETKRANVLTHPSFWERVGRQGRGAVMLAAAAAAACVVLAGREQSSFDADVLAGVDLVEPEE